MFRAISVMCLHISLPFLPVLLKPFLCGNNHIFNLANVVITIKIKCQWNSQWGSFQHPTDCVWQSIPKKIPTIMHQCLCHSIINQSHNVNQSKCSTHSIEQIMFEGSVRSLFILILNLDSDKAQNITRQIPYLTGGEKYSSILRKQALLSGDS